MRSTRHDNNKKQQRTKTPLKTVRKRHQRFARNRLPLGVAVGVVAAGMATAVAFAVTPFSGGSIGGSNTAVDTSPGEQTDPHVSGNLAVYTDQVTGSGVIRWYDFLNPAGSGFIPGGDVWDVDQLSDVNGSHIAFARQHADNSRSCMVFDAFSMSTIEIGQGQGAVASATALGSDTVAFVNSAINDGDIVVGSIAAPDAPLVNLSNSWRRDDSPAVSPLGYVVVWQSCEAPSVNCDIMKSVRSGGVWGAPQSASDTTAAERNPDTDGITLTYDSNRPGTLGGQDIFFQAISGGTETEVVFDGLQRNPSISGGVIAFESKSPGSTTWDLFLYQISTNTVFQLTSTPSTNEILNDVTTLDNGDVRVVWAADDDFFVGEHNIYARTFTIPEVTFPDWTPPTITITTPADAASYVLGQVVSAEFSCHDGSGGSGLATCTGTVANGDPIDTSGIGSHSFAVTAADNAGNSATATSIYNVFRNFNGFFQPIDNPPTVNIASAGSSIPVRFSLGGYQGLSIFAPGYPASGPIQCDASEPAAAIEETVMAGGSSLSYNASTDQYIYVWKTNKAWKGTCRMLVVGFNDDSQYLAKFAFR